jgi:hypothetical protein
MTQQRIGGKFALDVHEAMLPMARDYLHKAVKRDVEQKAREADRVIVGEIHEEWTAEYLRQGKKVEEPWQPGDSLAGALRVYLTVEAMTEPQE